MEWWQIKDLMITGAIIVGALIPVLAFTYRWLSKTSPRDRLHSKGDSSSAALQDARLDGIERQLEEMEGTLRRLADASEFDRKLKAGPAPDE